jgi:hypothetical protein
VVAGPVRERVVIAPTVGLTPPTVTYVLDQPHTRPPVPAGSAQPSGRCLADWPTPFRFFDLTTQGTRAFMYSYGSGPVFHLCFRVDGAVRAGGELTVDQSALGIVPTVTTGTNTGPCGSRIVHFDSPTVLDLSRSAGTSTPASVCLTVGATTLRVTVSGLNGGLPSPNIVTWTPDS